jgi:hypothetical protein
MVKRVATTEFSALGPDADSLMMIDLRDPLNRTPGKSADSLRPEGGVNTVSIHGVYLLYMNGIPVIFLGSPIRTRQSAGSRSCELRDFYYCPDQIF